MLIGEDSAAWCCVQAAEMQSLVMFVDAMMCVSIVNLMTINEVVVFQWSMEHRARQQVGLYRSLCNVKFGDMITAQLNSKMTNTI